MDAQDEHGVGTALRVKGQRLARCHVHRSRGVVHPRREGQRVEGGAEPVVAAEGRGGTGGRRNAGLGVRRRAIGLRDNLQSGD